MLTNCSQMLDVPLSLWFLENHHCFRIVRKGKVLEGRRGAELCLYIYKSRAHSYCKRRTWECVVTRSPSFRAYDGHRGITWCRRSTSSAEISRQPRAIWIVRASCSRPFLPSTFVFLSRLYARSTWWWPVATSSCRCSLRTAIWTARCGWSRIYLSCPFLVAIRGSMRTSDSSCYFPLSL